MASSSAIDPARASERIQHFIRKYVSASSAKGLVMGLSGGLDSSVVLKLAVNALGPEKVYGLVMPAGATPEQDVNDAIDLAKELKVLYDIIRLEPIIEAYRQVLPDNERATGNLTARVRANILYYHAALNGYLVAGTSDKSEKFLGYFTKYGDGAADMLPIAGLYKTDVRRLASYLYVPASIIEKKSSPRLWKNHLAEDEIGMSYDQLDPILRMLVDRKKTPKQAAKKLGAPLARVEKVNEMIENSSHKRRPAPFAKL